MPVTLYSKGCMAGHSSCDFEIHALDLMHMVGAERQESRNAASPLECLDRGEDNSTSLTADAKSLVRCSVAAICFDVRRGGGLEDVETKTVGTAR